MMLLIMKIIEVKILANESNLRNGKACNYQNY